MRPCTWGPQDQIDFRTYSDLSCTAIFDPDPDAPTMYNLNLTADGPGVIHVLVGEELDPVMPIEVPSSTDVVVDIEPDLSVDATFTGWVGSQRCVDLGLALRLELTPLAENLACTAEFMAHSRYLTLHTSTLGNVEVLDSTGATTLGACPETGSVADGKSDPVHHHRPRIDRDRSALVRLGRRLPGRADHPDSEPAGDRLDWSDLHLQCDPADYGWLRSDREYRRRHIVRARAVKLGAPHRPGLRGFIG